MSILSDFEDRVASAVEGLFAGAFRSPVQPAELARSLGRLMDDERMVGVGKVYAPSAYTVALSPEDSENLGTFKTVLAGELATFLAERAREQSYHLVTRPSVLFVVHDDLRLGRFRAEAEHVHPEEAFPAEGGAGQAAGVERPEHPAVRASHARTFDTISVGEEGHDIALRGDTMVIGRLKQCDICLADANASRRHAQLVREGGEWHVEDLESTNGTRLNGRAVTRAKLQEGDVIEIGMTRLTYHRGGG